MPRQSFRRRFLTPVFSLFLVMFLSWAVYNLAWRLESHALHALLALLSGTLLFASVALGAVPVYAVAYARGASVPERILACLVNPFLWATKECVRLSLSFTPLECLYDYVNPLNLWLLLAVAGQMAACEIGCRRMARNRGVDVRVWSPAALSVLACSLSLFVLLYAWGSGENAYVLFLEGYRRLFGAGV